MSRERVPQGMRRHAGAGPRALRGARQAAAHVGGREAPAAPRQEQRRLKALRENPAPVSQPISAAQQTSWTPPASSLALPAAPRRPGWQRFAIVVACIGVAVSALVALVFKLTAGLVTTTDGFFAAMQVHDFDRAKSYLAEDFKASTNDADLEQFFRRSALANYAKSTWSSRSVQNDRGQLVGSVVTTSGGVIPLEISLVKEKGEWRIFSLKKPQAGLASSETPKPTTEDQLRLVKSTTHAFAEAVARKDFGTFYGGISAVWQRQITPAKLGQVFQGFVDSGADLLVLDHLNPVITGADFDSDGLLVVSGRYLTSPSTFKFENRYLYEGLDWKLAGLNVHLVPETGAP